MLTRTVIGFVLLSVCGPATAGTDFACKPGSPCPTFEARGRSCSHFAMLCQGNCTVGRYTFDSSPQHCSKMCGGEKASCLKTGIWNGVNLILNVRRQ